MVDMGILDDGNAQESEFLGTNVSLLVRLPSRDSGRAEARMFGVDDTDI